MQLFLSGETFRYECENLCRLFFPYSPVKVEEPGAPLVEGPRAFASIEKEDGPYHYRVEVTDGEKTLVREDFSPDLQEYTMTNLLYRSFVELTGTTPSPFAPPGARTVPLFPRMWSTLKNWWNPIFPCSWWSWKRRPR